MSMNFITNYITIRDITMCLNKKYVAALHTIELSESISMNAGGGYIQNKISLEFSISTSLVAGLRQR